MKSGQNIVLLTPPPTHDQISPPLLLRQRGQINQVFFLAPPQRFPFPFLFFYSSISRMYLWQSEMHRWRKKRGKGHLSSFTQGRGEETAYRQNFFLFFPLRLLFGEPGGVVNPTLLLSMGNNIQRHIREIRLYREDHFVPRLVAFSSIFGIPR